MSPWRAACSGPPPSLPARPAAAGDRVWPPLKTPLSEIPSPTAIAKTAAALNMGTRRRAPVPRRAAKTSAVRREARPRRSEARGGNPSAARPSRWASASAVGSGRSVRISAASRARSSSWGSKGRPASARSIASSSRSISGSSGNSRSRSLIARPPQLLDHPVEPGAGVCLRDADHRADLGVGQSRRRTSAPPAPARAEPARRSPPEAPPGAAPRRLRARGSIAGSSAGSAEQRRLAAASAELVEGGVACDPEQPCALRASLGVEGAAASVGSLEGECRDVLGGSAVPQQPSGIGVDVVAGSFGRAPRTRRRRRSELGRPGGPESPPRHYYARSRPSSRSTIGPGAPPCNRVAPDGGRITFVYSTLFGHRCLPEEARPPGRARRSTGSSAGPSAGRADRRRDDLHQAGEVLGADRERRHQHHHVAERADDRPAPTRLERHPMAEAKGRVVLSEVDPDHEATASHLGDLGHVGDRRQELAEQADLRLQAKQRVARSRRRRGWRAPRRRRAGCP